MYSARVVIFYLFYGGGSQSPCISAGGCLTAALNEYTGQLYLYDLYAQVRMSDINRAALMLISESLARG